MKTVFEFVGIYPHGVGFIGRHVDCLRGLFEECQVCDRETFIKGFAKEFRVKGGEVNLEYTPPLPDGKRESVLSIEGHGGR